MTDQPTAATSDELDETQPGETTEYVEPTTDSELPERAEPVEPVSDDDNVVSTAEPS